MKHYYQHEAEVILNKTKNKIIIDYLKKQNKFKQEVIKKRKKNESKNSVYKR